MTETTTAVNSTNGGEATGVELTTSSGDDNKMEDVAIDITYTTPTGTSDEELQAAGVSKRSTNNLTTPTPSSIFDFGSNEDAFYQCEKRDFVWSNVNMKLLNKKNGGESDDNVKLKILDNVWGKAEAGKTTAIMGASGAGKTSLFQTLAGRVPTNNNKLTVEGNITLGGIEFNPLKLREHRKLIAYVSQEDSLHEASTPREALTFSARLRLPKTKTDDDITNIVNQCLNELGLTSAADTIIGGGMKKGISGGEKRRVSIGIELVSSPSLVFMDEPTSGLDSYAATQVMKLLKRVAKTHGSTVLFTIHQPSSIVFSSFDRLILLHKGRIMHQGDVKTIATDFDTLYGCPIPNNYNPADWLLDVAQTKSIEELEKCGFFPKQQGGKEVIDDVDKKEEQAAADTDDNDNCKLTELPKLSKGNTNLWIEFKLLQQREFRNLCRNPFPIIINVVVTSILACIFGVIFYDVGRQDRSQFHVVQSILGAIVNLLISTLMGQSNTAVFVFSADRPVFLREYSTDHYTIIPYFLSKLGSEAFNSFCAVFAQALIVYWLMGFQMTFGQLLVLNYSLALTSTAVIVMLGALLTEAKSVSACFTLVVVPQFYFSGLFIAIELIPKWVNWAQYLCSVTYGARLGLAYEMANCEPGLAYDNCQAILESNNVDLDHTWWYWLALMGLFVMFRLGGVYLLRSKANY